jgi:hypothetical protein
MLHQRPQRLAFAFFWRWYRSLACAPQRTIGRAALEMSSVWVAGAAFAAAMMATPSLAFVAGSGGGVLRKNGNAFPVSLGPVGPGPWNDPAAGAAAQGIPATAVARVAEDYGNFEVPFCLSVVKNGFLVVDEAYGYGTT